MISNNTQVISPFWTQSFDSKKENVDKVKKVLKTVWKFSKLFIYAFLLLMGLWGCFQTMFDPTVKTNTTIGSAMEFGFSFGTTGDYRYDLAGGNNEYYAFTSTNWNIDDYGPFFGLFVYPGAMLMLYIMYPLKDAWGGLNALLALFILLFIIRVITFLISIRSTLQSERMSEIQGKLAEINAKYKDVKKDMATRQKKQLETNELYKKYNIKPFAMFEQIFITMPIFLIVYRVVTILRPIKVISLFTIWNLSLSPLNEIFSNLSDGGWKFIFFLIILIPVQILSQKLPQMLAKRRNFNAKTSSDKGDKSAKRMRTMQIVIIVVMVFIVVQSPASVGLYWFMSALFTIMQSIIIHKYLMKKKKRGISLEDKLKQLGIK
ncbi:MAG: membrane protein insertase YidC [Malacoplasma sp.]|nr:membrane protein insertase YidC [Malacoplasma sp.]